MVAMPDLPDVGAVERFAVIAAFAWTLRPSRVVEQGPRRRYRPTVPHQMKSMNTQLLRCIARGPQACRADLWRGHG